MQHVVNHRIKNFMDKVGITAYRVCKEAGLDSSSFSRIMNDKCEPGFMTLSRIAIAYPQLNTRWLLTGEGSMIDAAVPLPPSPDSPFRQRGRPRKIAAPVAANAPTAANTPSQPIDAEISANSGVNTLEKKYKIKCGPIVRNLWNMRKAGPLNLPL